MKRFGVLSFGLALGLVASLASCDGGDADDDSADTADTADTEGERECGDALPDVMKDETVESILVEWGSACTDDGDCAVLGDGALCESNILGVYDLPGGYCTKNCALPDSQTTFVLDSPDCDPDGGVACIGAMGIFNRCAIPCTTDSECGRTGYACIPMPNISAEGDPSFCLMSAEDCCTTDSGECA